MRFFSLLFMAFFAYSVHAGHASFHSSFSADAVASRVEAVSQAYGFKWIRKVRLEDELGPGAPEGWAVYFCDVAYMAGRKAENQLAGVTGPCRSIILATPGGSDMYISLPTAKRSALKEPIQYSLTLEARMLMVSALATESTVGEEQPLTAVSPVFQQATGMPYPETMNNAQAAIQAAGFELVRVQHMDKGLVSGGFVSGPYKILYVRPKQMPANISPQLALGMPVAVLVMESDDGEGVVATMGLGSLVNGNLPASHVLWLWGEDNRLKSALAAL